MLRRSSLIATATASLFALSACGGGSSDPGSSAEPVESASFEAGTTMADIAAAKKITIGTKFDQPGFGLVGLTDQPEGFDVEIGKGIAAQLGLTPDQITWVEAPSAQRENLIEQDKADLVIATYTINDKRKERISFAGPYYVAGQQIMVDQDDDRINGPEDLKTNPDVKVCSVTGSTPGENIRQYLAGPTTQLVLFDVYDDCLGAMKNGQVQAMTTDNVILTGYVAENEGEFKLVGKQFTEEPYGIGLKKGDVAFCEFVNGALTTMSKDGDYEKAWTSTAGEYPGTEVPTLPTLAPCA